MAPSNLLKRWWLSFCDPEKPEGQQFLGVCILFAPDFGTAVAGASTMGLNPGGEVLGSELPETTEVDLAWMERLLSRAEAEALTPKGN